ncbi:MAG TPA: hypothetical protein VKS21_12980, partial [Spirochaetota bacterium]|nr:hypothetical protein [Spirochaetota bacterium]
MKYCMILLSLLLLLNQSLTANTAHNTWDKLDDPIRRGAWVWKPNDPGVNKWDGTSGWKQIYNNYQGCADLIIDFLNSKSIRIIYLYSGCWEWEETYFKTAAGGNPGLYNETGLAEFINKAQNYDMKV